MPHYLHKRISYLGSASVVHRPHQNPFFTVQFCKMITIWLLSTSSVDFGSSWHQRETHSEAKAEGTFSLLFFFVRGQLCEIEAWKIGIFHVHPELAASAIAWDSDWVTSICLMVSTSLPVCRRLMANTERLAAPFLPNRLILLAPLAQFAAPLAAASGLQPGVWMSFGSFDGIEMFLKVGGRGTP